MNSDAIHGTYLHEVRLTAFKSFRHETLRLSPLTVLIGRNGSGKSNALDAIEVLSRLASGEDVRDALEGRRRDSDPVRGGVEGCAPHGEDRFALGCTVVSERGPIDLDVTVQTRPDVRIVDERISGTIDGKRITFTGLPEDRQLSRDSGPGATRLLSPWATRDEGPTGQELAFAGKQLFTTVKNVFHLDPVPHLMRQYAAARDFELRRTADNISAAVKHLHDNDEPQFRILVQLLRGISDHEIARLLITGSDLGDVMLALDEGASGLTPAREMSDGMLRFLAICTALLSGRGGLDLTSPDGLGVTRTLMLVIEELENGLHPSQATTVLRLIKQASEERTTQVLITTHSPALLSALDGADHRGVVVCSRDRQTGQSRITPLTEVDGYAATMASGTLGEVVTRNALPTDRGREDYTDFDRLLGLG